MRDRNGKDIYRVVIGLIEIGDTVNNINIHNGNGTQTHKRIITVHNIPSWTLALSPMIGAVINEPQTVDILLVDGEVETSLGVMAFGLANVPPLSPDRIAAIKSDPRTVKAVRYQLGCKNCQSNMRIYAALDRSGPASTDAIWYQDVPDIFRCSCGDTNMDLSIIRSNLHALLGQTNINISSVDISTMFEQRSIDDLSQSLYNMLERDPKEEDVQSFFGKNTIVFHHLSPYRIYNKPPILTKHQADFAILDSRRTLIFIEIERPGIRILRKDGATSAEMEHAISQVRDWLFLYEKQRGGVMECLDLRDEEVTKVRGLVIAGRDKDNDQNHLRRFKWQDRGMIDCITYDDLLGMLSALSREMKHIK
jgi:hypothetical protein